ncbi:MAG: nucleotidyl transferase AbiEii/AbiGii toxin family protein [Patescibacteria group bacterium]
MISLIGKESSLCNAFYLGGGTALAEFYLHHRLSEDLDFFSENEFDPMSITVFFKKIEREAGILRTEYEQSFNRNLFFLELKNDRIKTEFTYFPFQRVEKDNYFKNIQIDSLLDIAINKVFTIYQKPRSRDFIDLYCILQKEKDWTLEELGKKAQIKFDTYLDPIQLGSQLVKVTELKDYPRMIIELKEKDWQDFFLHEASKLEKRILS